VPELVIYVLVTKVFKAHASTTLICITTWSVQTTTARLRAPANLVLIALLDKFVSMLELFVAPTAARIGSSREDYTQQILVN
jgi:hypothetical protein